MASQPQLRYGAARYRQRSEETSTLLLQLFTRYRLEATLMKDALQQMAEETIEQLLKELPLEKRLLVPVDRTAEQPTVGVEGAVAHRSRYRSGLGRRRGSRSGTEGEPTQFPRGRQLVDLHFPDLHPAEHI